jgi:hypothetical protein
MKKILTVATILLLAIPLMAPRTEAQVSFIPYIGYDFDIGDGSLLVGVGTEFGLLPVGVLPVAVNLRPSAEYYFVDTPAGFDSWNFFQINADAIATLATGPGLGVFAGAGLGIGFRSFEAGNVSDSSTDFGVNFLGGAQFGTGFAIPFVQARVTLMDGTRFALLGGVKLGL